MIEHEVAGDPGDHDLATRWPVGASTISAWLGDLAGMSRDRTDPERIDLIHGLEELKAAAAAAQARLTADFDASQRRAQSDAGVPARRQGEGIASQIALARRESPVRGGQHQGLAKALVHEMPGTHAAMTTGLISERRATLLVRETACLSREDRTAVDATMTADLDKLQGMGDRALVREARRLAYQLDPESVVRRNRRAESDRHVSIRPAPDAMTYLTALLPVAQGVAAYAALKREADTVRSQGDPRSRGQVMADTLVVRVTGQEQAHRVPLAVNLVMTDRTLLRGDDEPAEIQGYDVLPAEWARDLVGNTLEDTTQVWLRRLYSCPGTGQLVALDSRQRRAPEGLAEFVRLRDGGSCRTPWCDAPIRHIDHAVGDASGGQTQASNLNGRCERCNYAKEALGWHSQPRPGPRHTVVVTTPTGHTYRATAPPLPSADGRTPSRMEIYVRELLLTA